MGIKLACKCEIFLKDLMYATNIIYTIYKLRSLRKQDGFSSSSGWSNQSMVNYLISICECLARVIQIGIR